jgi:hypothetical protein
MPDIPATGSSLLCAGILQEDEGLLSRRSYFGRHASLAAHFLLDRKSYKAQSGQGTPGCHDWK